MSTTPGKVVMEGVTTIHGEKVFVLKFLQARDPEWVGETFFAKYDPVATWLTDLRPAFGEESFFFDNVRFLAALQAPAVPEPSTGLLLGLALVGLAAWPQVRSRQDCRRRRAV